ncbi:unnamed protein product [Sphacelaria rigidula]
MEEMKGVDSSRAELTGFSKDGLAIETKREDQQSDHNSKSTAPCPIARNAALLEELDSAESKVAELLEVAAETLDELARGVVASSPTASFERDKVEESNKRFLRLVSEVHRCLAPKAEWIRDYKEYPRSSYGERKELELLHEKAAFLRSELANMAAEEEDGRKGDDGDARIGAVFAASGSSEVIAGDPKVVPQPADKRAKGVGAPPVAAGRLLEKDNEAGASEDVATASMDVE